MFALETKAVPKNREEPGLMTGANYPRNFEPNGWHQRCGPFAKRPPKRGGRGPIIWVILIDSNELRRTS